MMPGNLMTILGLLFKIVYVAHFTCCFWFWLSGITDEDRLVNNDGTVTVVCDSDETKDSWVTTLG